LKTACEAVVRDAYGEAGTIVRPGLIVGPWDKTDRFTWWPARIARGGRVAAPGRPARPVQFIDVRDLAEWMVKLLEQDACGDYNATSPPGAITMGALLEACVAAAGSDARIEWIDEDFLAAQKVEPWSDMPVWIPEGDAAMRGFMGARVEKACATGLDFRPLAVTVRDTLEWARAGRGGHPWKAGLDPTREGELLRGLGCPARVPTRGTGFTRATERARAASMASRRARMSARSISSTSKRLTAPLS
jgi:2'-hydroxyisoflavone reductase